ncbi:MAG: Fur family transcriptional regulator [Acidobacteriota bacterium]|nr:Fur family transcriptional regulator [Acidobacteriota bacterium]
MDCLREHGIQPSAQRVAVADFVLQTDEHPSAERVLSEVQEGFPMISRATVYNTLHLFVERGLLREVKLLGGSSVVYDPNTDKHHHLIDDETGEIHDIPWEAVDVDRVGELEGYEVREYQVVFKGKRQTSR